MPGRLRAEHVVLDVVAHHRGRSAGTPSIASADAKYAGGGLPADRRRAPGRLLEPGDVRAAVELRALGRPPIQVAVHADQRGAVHQQSGRRG